MFAASEGGAEAQRTFTSLGISIKGADGKLKDADVVLGEVADKFKSMPPGVKRTALAMQVFGRSGAQLTQLLEKGADGIAALRQEAEELGLVLDQDTVDAGAEFNDTVDTFNASLVGLRNTIAGPLLKNAGNFIKLMTSWIKTNRLWIKQKVHTAIDAISDSMATLWKFSYPIRALLGAIVSNMTLLKIVAAGLAVILASKLGVAIGTTLISALGALSKAFQISGNEALLMNLKMFGIGLLIAFVVAMLALLADDFIKFFTGGNSLIGEFLKSWDEFIDDILNTPNFAENHPILTFLAATLDAVLHLQRSLGELFDTLGLTKKLRQLAGNAPSDKENADFLKDLDDAEFAASMSPEDGFGIGGSSPDAAGAASSAGRPVVNAPQMSNNITVNAAPGMSEEAVAGAVNRQIQEAWNTKMRAAIPAVR
jgi:hypothetical protein